MPSLRAYLDFRQFGVMPAAGGLNDQDPAILRDFRFLDTEFVTEATPKKPPAR